MSWNFSDGSDGGGGGGVELASISWLVVEQGWIWYEQSSSTQLSNWRLLNKKASVCSSSAHENWLLFLVVVVLVDETKDQLFSLGSLETFDELNINFDKKL